ncbi:acyl carrier protein [Streptomyces sp. ISL-98]|uniref:acyl carrier protein n=1 Tax=Streptomyces sp. ISL-98 TaxID=2819192 RepID=UPI001BE4FE54|nr:acyl carrier protein [Streptomyces sp. ISL-98]MBT2510612.1 acyl carrier protein [Streptomyces sp. ISL-98]
MQQTASASGDTAARIAEIRDIAADIFSVEPEEVEAAESFVTDLDADSLLAIELLSQLEKKYDIHIPEGEVPRLVTLRATYEVVAEISGW